MDALPASLQGIALSRHNKSAGWLTIDFGFIVLKSVKVEAGGPGQRCKLTRPEISRGGRLYPAFQLDAALWLHVVEIVEALWARSERQFGGGASLPLILRWRPEIQVRGR